MTDQPATAALRVGQAARSTVALNRAETSMFPLSRPNLAERDETLTHAQTVAAQGKTANPAEDNGVINPIDGGEPMAWVNDDGGRAAAGFRGETGDCAVRAIAIATGIPYRDVYDALTDVSKELAGTTRGRNKVRGKTPRVGTDKRVIRETLARLAWRWTPTMSIGSGTTVHLRPDELPAGRLVVSVSKHLCAVIDGVVHDNHDPSREGTRAVYGYWSSPNV